MRKEDLGWVLGLSASCRRLCRGLCQTYPTLVFGSRDGRIEVLLLHQLGDLDGIEGRALADLITYDPEGEGVAEDHVLADAAY